MSEYKTTHEGCYSRMIGSYSEEIEKDVELAINNYYFLLPKNIWVSGDEFAEIIEFFSDSVQAKRVAASLRIAQ